MKKLKFIQAFGARRIVAIRNVAVTHVDMKIVTRVARYITYLAVVKPVLAENRKAVDGELGDWLSFKDVVE